MKFIEKKYYTFKELEARWECTTTDLIQSVIDGELVPSFHVPSGSYLLNQFLPCDPQDPDSTCLPRQMNDPRIGDVNNEVREWVSGFHYLIVPNRVGGVDGSFSYFSTSPVGHDIGDICYSFEQPIGIEDVLRSGTVMAAEVARVEARSRDKPEQDKSLSTAERSSLLKLVIGMAIKGYSFDPMSKKNSTPKEIVDDLAGLGIPLTDDTARKYLREAVDTVLPKKPNQS